MRGYLNIFRLFYSKYSLPVSIHLLQRLNSDLNACSSSFCGTASSDRVIAVFLNGRIAVKKKNRVFKNTCSLLNSSNFESLQSKLILEVFVGDDVTQ